jgi:hypothetical protein
MGAGVPNTSVKEVFNFGFAPRHRDAKVFVVNKLARRFRNNNCFLDGSALLAPRRYRVHASAACVCVCRNKSAPIYYMRFRIGFQRRLFLGVIRKCTRVAAIIWYAAVAGKCFIDHSAYFSSSTAPKHIIHI